MSPLMMFLALTLPLLTAATQALNGTDLYTLFPSHPMGDVLNITQCYCQSSGPLPPDTLSSDATFGYYYLFSYWNYHLSRTYSISVNCTSSAPHNSNGTKPAKCMENIKKHKEICQDYPDGNQFCYKFKDDVENVRNGIQPASKFGFNGQKRGLPVFAADEMTLHNRTQNCGFYCNKELGGLLTAQAPITFTFIPGFGKVSNSIVSYPDLDDMCFTCA